MTLANEIQATMFEAIDFLKANFEWLDENNTAHLIVGYMGTLSVNCFAEKLGL